MDIKNFVTEYYIRALALVCLLLGLSDASRLLGLGGGAESPMQSLGTTGFVLLAIFAIARLFAGVGLWIDSSWGAVLLVGATGAELGLVFTGNPDVHVSFFGLLVRFVLLVGILGFLGARFWQGREHVHD